MSVKETVGATISLGILISVVIAYMTFTDGESRLFNIQFLLVLVCSSLLITIWIVQMLSGESTTELRAKYGDLTVDLTGNVGVFFLSALGFFFAYTTLQEKWWSKITISDPTEVNKIISQHSFLKTKIGDDADFNHIGEVLERFSIEQHLRNRIIGQYCYFANAKKFKNMGWFMGRLSIQPIQGAPYILLSGRTNTFYFESQRFSVSQDAVVYDWSAEDSSNAEYQPSFGVAKLKFTNVSQDDNANVIEMRGRYADFDKPGGNIILVRNKGQADYGKNFCDKVASERGMKKISLEDIETFYQSEVP